MGIPSNSKQQEGNKLTERIETGALIEAKTIRTLKELAEAEAEEERWHAYNVELLRSILDNPGAEREYAESMVSVTRKGDSFPDQLEAFRARLRRRINVLRSFQERLDLMTTVKPPDLDSVFLVHGHDGVRETVARFIEKLRLKVIILDEQPLRGRTIIEQIEHNSRVGFAIILLTPDDVGGSQLTPHTLRSRARQNVIFELGYFCGLLGRSRVCALYKDDLELPSDFQGVLYLPLDSQEAWKLKLIRELKAAGIPVDPAKVI